MTPLDAATAAARLNSSQQNPDRLEDPGVVCLSLKGLTGAGMSIATFRQIITAAWGGFPVFDHPFPGVGCKNFACKIKPDPAAGLDSSNLVPNGYFDAGIAGYAQSKATGSAAHIAGDGYFGNGCLEQTNPGTNAGEGIELSPSIVLPTNYPAGSRLVASAWVKSVSGSTTCRLALTERDAADAVIGSATNTNFTLTAGQWRNGYSNKTLTTGVKANLSVCTASAVAATVRIDSFIYAICPPQAFTNVDIGENLSEPFHLHAYVRNRAPNGRLFDPDRIYAILDQLYGTVTSDKDEVARGAYQFTIAP